MSAITMNANTKRTAMWSISEYHSISSYNQPPGDLGESENGQSLWRKRLINQLVWGYHDFCHQNLALFPCNWYDIMGLMGIQSVGSCFRFYPVLKSTMAVMNHG